MSVVSDEKALSVEPTECPQLSPYLFPPLRFCRTVAAGLLTSQRAVQDEGTLIATDCHIPETQGGQRGVRCLFFLPFCHAGSAPASI